MELLWRRRPVFITPETILQSPLHENNQAANPEPSEGMSYENSNTKALTPNPKPLNPKPQTLNPKPENPKPLILNPQTPRPQTLNPKTPRL